MMDFAKMTPEEFAVWQAQNSTGTGTTASSVMQTTPPPARQVAPPEPRPAAEVWTTTEYDFTCPSGAQCRMRKLAPEKLIEHGILDKLTGLPGISAEVVEKAEAAGPPANPLDAMPSKDEVHELLGIMEMLIPLVVVEPKVYPVPTDGKAREVGLIYTDSIDLEDRVAIMEKAVGGTRAYEAFRAGSI